MSAWVRRCLTVASLLAVWLVVRPASAAAPVCDERGASMLAPVPVLDVEDQSVDVGEHGDPCDFWIGPDKSCARDDHPAPVTPSVHLDATLPVRALEIPPALAVLRPMADREGVARRGVRSSLERPPRRLS